MPLSRAICRRWACAAASAAAEMYGEDALGLLDGRGGARGAAQLFELGLEPFDRGRQGGGPLGFGNVVIAVRDAHEIAFDGDRLRPDECSA